MRMKQFWKWPAVFLALLTLASGVPAGAESGSGSPHGRGAVPASTPEPIAADPELAVAVATLVECVANAADPALAKRGGTVGLRAAAGDIEAAVLELDRRLPDALRQGLLSNGLLADVLAGTQALASPSKRVREQGRSLLAGALPHLERLQASTAG